MMTQDSNPKMLSATSAGGFGEHREELLQPGDVVLGRYDVIRLLGRGGMGSVYKVHDRKTNADFALKYLHRQQTTDIAWRRFDIEVRTANKLNHENLIKVYDVGLLPEGQPYFVMDLVEGRTLADNIQQYGPLRIIDALQIMIQVAFAVADAHDGGVIHRDIKPSNIMICDGENVGEGSIKLVDFGIAKLTGADEISQLTLTRTGEIFGSPYYMSPEQCAGQAVDHRSDIYSFGCVLYEALAGAPPLLSDNALTQMMKHQNEKPLPLTQASLGVNFPEELEYIVAKLLEKNPDDRYQNAHELASDLIDVEQSVKSGQPTLVFSSKQPDQRIVKRVPPRSLLEKSYGPLTLPMMASLVSIGLVTGLVVGRYIVPDTPTEKHVALMSIDQIKASSSGDNNVQIKVVRVDDGAPFSVKLRDSQARVFNFPPDSLGRIDLNDGRNRDAVREQRIDFFRPFGFIPTVYAYSHPSVFDRFEEDEIKTIDLRGCSKNLNQILKSLSKQTELSKMDLSDSIADNESIALLNSFNNLQALWLRYTKVDGAAFAKQKNLLSHLRKLTVEKLDQVGALLSVLPTAAPKLEEVSICRSNLNRSDAEKISRCNSIFKLDLTGNHTMNDEAFEPIGRMTQLKQVDLEDVPLTYKSVKTLANFKNANTVKIEKKGFTLAQQKELERKLLPNAVVWLTTSTDYAPRIKVKSDLNYDEAKPYGSKP